MSKVSLGVGVSPVISSGRSDGAIRYITDTFETSQAAPITNPRVCEPNGRGSLKIVDTQGYMPIQNSRLEVANVNAAGDPSFWDNNVLGIERQAGLMASAFISADGRSFFGFDNDQNPWALKNSIQFHASNLFTYYESGGTTATLGNFSAGSTYFAVVICRSAGAFVIVQGQAYTDWTLMWVANVNTTATLYVSWFLSTNGNQNHTLDRLRVARIPAPWQEDNGIATDDTLSGARSQADTYIHEADCLIEWEVTTIPTGATPIRFAFRRIDNSNRWYILVNSAGNIALQEVVAGVNTNRGSVAGALSGGERLMVVADDNDLHIYYDGVSAIVYGSANSFKTETNGRIDTMGTGSLVSDVISWPRVISGAAKDSLEKFV